MLEQKVEDRCQFFTGEVILIYLVNAPVEFQGGVAIRDPKMEETNGRVFVVGNVPKMLNDWSAGQRIGVAFDQVAHFLEFFTEKEFIERSASWNPTGNVPS